MDFPEGWRLTTVGDAGRLQLGRQRAPKYHSGVNLKPYLRVANVFEDRIDLSDLKSMNFEPDEFDRYRLWDGDVLLNEGQTPDLLGRPAIYRKHHGELAFTNSLIRFQAGGDVDPRWALAVFRHHMHSGRFKRESRITTNIAHLSLGRLRDVEFPIPPLDEQLRIVSILEDHLSRLAAAESNLRLVQRRLKTLIKSVLVDLVPDAEDYPSSWERSTVAEAGSVELGRQRHPDWHTGPNMKPYLRVANVFEDRIDARDLKEMHWPDATFERFKLRPGDVLLNEGQTPELLGRPAIYRGEPEDVAFTNSLLRFNASDRVLPEFALLVFRRHMHAGRFARESRITTNIAHLSASRLKPIEFPIPSLNEQQRIVDASRAQLDNVEFLGSAIDAALVRSAGLSRSLLAAAYSGRLTEPAMTASDIREVVTV